MTFAFSNNKTYKQDFYIADVTRPILGANFFTTYNVVIDRRGRRPIDFNQGNDVSTESEPLNNTLSGLSIGSSNHFESLLLQFPNILHPQFQSRMNKHGVQHHIATRAPPPPPIRVRAA